MNFIDAILASSKRFGRNNTAIQDQIGEHSYKDVFIQSCAIHLYLEKQGIAYGSSVGLILPNVSGFLSATLACSMLSLTPAFINYGSSRDMIASCIGTANIKSLLVSKALLEKLNLTGFIQQFDEMGIRVIALEDIKASMTLSDKLTVLYRYLRLPAKQRRDRTSHAQKKNSARNIIFFTSGSESAPKAVVLTEHSILANCDQVAARLTLNPSDILFNPLPVFHCFGFTVGLMYPLVKGTGLYLAISPIDYRGVVKKIQQTKSSILLGTNTLLKGYFSSTSAGELDSLRAVFAGGEALTQDVVALGKSVAAIEVCGGYGATEASPVIAFNSIVENRENTVGKILDNIRYKLLPVEGFDQGGELCISGPNVMEGYFNDINEPLLGLNDGWYHTGDICHIDEGYLKIVDRVKRFAKIAGEMVSLTQVEASVKDIWPVYDHAAISINADVLKAEDTHSSEVIVLVSTFSEMQLNDLRKQFRQRQIMSLWLPNSLMIVDELPKLANGKVDYVTIKKQFINSLKEVNTVSDERPLLE